LIHRMPISKEIKVLKTLTMIIIARIKDDGTLIYKPLNKEILSTGEKEDILGKMYNDDKIGVGIGVKTFYNKVADQYVGIGKKK